MRSFAASYSSGSSRKRNASQAFISPMMMTSRGWGTMSSTMVRWTRPLHLGLGGAVRRGIGAAARDVAGQGPEPTELVPEDLVGDQALQHLIEDVIGPNGSLFDPVLCVVGGGIGGDLRQYGVEQRVAGGSRVGQRERFQIGIDAPFEGEIGKHGAGQDAGQVPAAHLLQVAALFIQEQEDQLFSQSHRVLLGGQAATSTGFTGATPTPLLLSSERACMRGPAQPSMKLRTPGNVVAGVTGRASSWVTPAAPWPWEVTIRCGACPPESRDPGSGQGMT